ncbi:hypothetical protein LJC33_01845 [Eubacteriales bacterium OttesenSCG-928-N13]|nr:hypothetical protein [Eubacteriales bacterium OttesenSCG-928-N13]
MIFNMTGGHMPETEYGHIEGSWKSVSSLATSRTVYCDFAPFGIYGYTYHSNSGKRTMHGCVMTGRDYPESPTGWGCSQLACDAKSKSGYTFGYSQSKEQYYVKFQPYNDSSHGGNVYVKVFGGGEVQPK